MNDSSRKIVIIVLIIALTGGIAKFLMSFKEEAKPNELKEIAPLVSVQKVGLQTDTVKVAIYGYLESVNDIQIFPEVAGKIKNSNFREGLVFKKGEVIAQIDDTEFLNGLKSARSQFYGLLTSVMADLQFDYPDQVARWNQYLLEVSFDEMLPQIPKVTDPKLKTFLAGKGVFNSYYSITSQEERLSKYIIKAPFDGVLQQVSVKPGTVVRNGQNIGRFVSVDEYELEASVRLKDIAYLEKGDEVVLRAEDMAGEWIGNIDRISKTVDQQTQNLSVFVRLKSAELFNGMYLTGDIDANVVTEATWVNRTLLDGNRLFSVDNNRLVSTEVEVLSYRNGQALVKGLKEGQTILAKPLNTAKNGMKVRF